LQDHEGTAEELLAAASRRLFAGLGEAVPHPLTGGLERRHGPKGKSREYRDGQEKAEDPAVQGKTLEDRQSSLSQGRQSGEAPLCQEQAEDRAGEGEDEALQE